MTTFQDSNTASAWVRPARGAAGGLALAAAPVFALMAWVAAIDAPPVALCAAGSDLLPVDGMTAMYLLMSLFHLPPWLRLAANRPRAATRPRP